MSGFLSLNGKIIHRDELYISTQNRAFRYGDGVFESIRLQYPEVLWADLHFQRLQKAISILHFRMMPDWSFDVFKKSLLDLYAANSITTKAARVRLSLYRNDGGLYTPYSNNASILIEMELLDNENFTLNAIGIDLGMYQDIRKPLNALSGLKSANALLYVLASMYKRDKGFGDVLILNDEGMIAEATSSNIFIVSNESLYTPPISQACVEGVMRAVVIGLAQDLFIPVHETTISPLDLEDADEVFLTNAIQGIRWVKHFNHKRFKNKLASELIAALNNKASTQG